MGDYRKRRYGWTLSKREECPSRRTERGQLSIIDSRLQLKHQRTRVRCGWLEGRKRRPFDSEGDRLTLRDRHTPRSRLSDVHAKDRGLCVRRTLRGRDVTFVQSNLSRTLQVDLARSSHSARTIPIITTLAVVNRCGAVATTKP